MLVGALTAASFTTQILVGGSAMKIERRNCHAEDQQLQRIRTRGPFLVSLMVSPSSPSKFKSMAGSATQSPANIDFLLGPLLIGTIFNAFVYGICLMQFSTYWTSQWNDSYIIKCDALFRSTVLSLFFDNLVIGCLLDGPSYLIHSIRLRLPICSGSTLWTIF